MGQSDLQEGNILGNSEQVGAEEHHFEHAGDAFEAFGGVAGQLLTDFGVILEDVVGEGKYVHRELGAALGYTLCNRLELVC